MSFEFKPGNYFARIYFISGNKADWLAAVWRENDGAWQFDYRFRYYADTGNDDDDKKSWWHVDTLDRGPVAPVLATLRPLLELIRTTFGGDGKLHELIVESDDPKVAFDIARPGKLGPHQVRGEAG